MKRTLANPLPWLPVLACLVAGSGSTSAVAQTPARPAEAKAEAKPDSKADADAAAMDRARRLADNPMRLILEASRTRARGVVVTPVAEVADTGSLRRTAAGSPDTVAGAPAPIAPAAAAAPAPAAPSPQLQQLRSDLSAAPNTGAAAGPAAQAVATQIAPSAMPSAAVAPALPALNAMPTAPRLDALAAPQLLRMVEPDIPVRVLDQVGSQREVMVEFTVRPDGTTSDINLLPPSPRQLQRFVVDAVSQWRYAPLSEARKLRVQIVFNAS